MAGRKSLRTRRRSHHIAAETIEEPLDDLPEASKPQTKRQRRLTAHQRGTNAALGGLKQLQAPKEAAVAAVPAPKQHLNPPVEAKIEEKPAPPIAREIEKPKESSSMSESDSESDFVPSSRKPCYISSGTSAKMAPGKRIKWRSAISEGDIIRQDLSLAFLFASLSSTGGAAPADGPKEVCEPPYPLKTPAFRRR